MNIHSQISAPPHAAAQVSSLVPQPHLMHSVSTGAIGTPYAGHLHQGPVNPAAVQNNQPARVSGLGGNMMAAALQGLVEGAFQGVGQAVVQDVIGSGGGGGDEASY